MSKPRYHWWGYVKSVIRDYPNKCRDLAGMKAQCITPAYSSMPGSSEPQRGPEKLALKGFAGTKKKEFEAVEKAIRQTEAYIDGEKRLDFIDRVFWSCTHTLEGAALKGGVCSRTGQEWHRRFIRLVAIYMELLDDSNPEEKFDKNEKFALKSQNKGVK